MQGSMLYMRGRGVPGVLGMWPVGSRMVRVVKAANFEDEWTYDDEKQLYKSTKIVHPDPQHPFPRGLWSPDYYPLWPGSAGSQGYVYGFDRSNSDTYPGGEATRALPYPTPAEGQAVPLNGCLWVALRNADSVDEETNPLGDHHSTPDPPENISDIKIGDYFFLNAGYELPPPEPIIVDGEPQYPPSEDYPTYYMFLDYFDQDEKMQIWKSVDDGYTWTLATTWQPSYGWMIPPTEVSDDALEQGLFSWGAEYQEPSANGRTRMPFWALSFVHAGKGRLILPNSYVAPIYNYPAYNAGREPERKPPVNSPVKLSTFNGNVFVVDENKAYGRTSFYVWQTRETCTPTWQEGTIGPMSVRVEGKWWAVSIYSHVGRWCCDVTFPADRATSRITDYYYIGAPLETKMYKLGLWSSSDYLYHGYDWEAVPVDPYVEENGDGYGGPLNDNLQEVVLEAPVQSSTKWGVQHIGGSSAPFKADGTGYKKEGYCEVECVGRGPENIYSRQNWGPPEGTYRFQAWNFHKYWSGPHSLGSPYHWNGSPYGDFTPWKPWRTYIYTLIEWYGMPIPVTSDYRIIWNPDDPAYRLSDDMKEFLLNHDLYSIYHGTFAAFYYWHIHWVHAPPEGKVMWEWVGSQPSDWTMFRPSTGGSVPAVAGYEYPVFVPRVGKSLSEDEFLETNQISIVEEAKKVFRSRWQGIDKTKTYKRTSGGELEPLSEYKPGWAEYLANPGAKTFHNGTCGVQIIAHGTGDIDNTTVVSPNRGFTMHQAGEASNPPQSIYLGSSPMTRGPFFVPWCEYTKWDDYRPAMVVERNTTWGIRKYYHENEDDTKELRYEWAWTNDNGTHLYMEECEDEDYKPTETEHQSLGGVVNAAKRLFHYLGKDRDNRHCILWAKGGINDWVITWDFGLTWYEAIPDYCGDRLNGRIPIKEYITGAGLQNPSLYVTGPGRYLLVATISSPGSLALEELDIRENYVVLQDGQKLSAGGGISDLTNITGYRQEVDQEGNPVDVATSLDLEQFAYDFDKVSWEGGEVIEQQETLDVIGTTTARRYVILEIWEFGQLGSFVGVYNHEPQIDTDEDHIDPTAHEHALIPVRCPTTLSTDIHPNEDKRIYGDLGEEPRVPFEDPEPVSE